MLQAESIRRLGLGARPALSFAYQYYETALVVVVWLRTVPRRLCVRTVLRCVQMRRSLGRVLVLSHARV